MLQISIRIDDDLVTWLNTVDPEISMNKKIIRALRFARNSSPQASLRQIGGDQETVDSPAPSAQADPIPEDTRTPDLAALIKRIEALELIPPPIPVPDTEPKKGDEDEFRMRFNSLSQRLSKLEQFTHMTLGSALGRVEKALKTNPSFEPPAQYT